MPKVEIFNRRTGAIIINGEYVSAKDAVEQNKTNLIGANLTRADLEGADLTGANLTRADLEGADLTGANLTGANLIGANFRGANLTGANLIGANFRGANLAGADLIGADLIDGGQDYRGYRFVGNRNTYGKLVIYAGCKSFSSTEALDYPYAKQLKNPKITQECILKVKMISEVAKLKEWKVD